MLVGITGKICAGKGEAAQLLVDMGFEHYRYSDVLKDMMKKKGMEITREHLQDFGAQLKEEKGLDEAQVARAQVFLASSWLDTRITPPELNLQHPD